MGKDKDIQLYECCDEQLCKDLTWNAGNSLTYRKMMRWRRQSKNSLLEKKTQRVARVQLHYMRQDWDETIHSFGLCLCGQASICKFLVKCCNTWVNYTHIILHGILTYGPADAEIQLDLPGDKNQEMTFQFIEEKEAGKRSAWHLLKTQGADGATANTAVPSRMSQNPAQPSQTRSQQECPSQDQEKRMPGTQQDMWTLGLPQPLWDCMPQQGQPKKPVSYPPSNANGEAEDAVFDALCTATSHSQHPSKHAIMLDIVQFVCREDRNSKWTPPPGKFLSLDHYIDKAIEKWTSLTSRARRHSTTSASENKRPYRDSENELMLYSEQLTKEEHLWSGRKIFTWLRPTDNCRAVISTSEFLRTQCKNIGT